MEPLFHHLRVLEGGRPLTPTGEFLAVAQAAVTALGTYNRWPRLCCQTSSRGCGAALPPDWKELTWRLNRLSHSASSMLLFLAFSCAFR